MMLRNCSIEWRLGPENKVKNPDEEYDNVVFGTNFLVTKISQSTAESPSRRSISFGIKLSLPNALVSNNVF
jgi:hypothetical protein